MLNRDGGLIWERPGAYLIYKVEKLKYKKLKAIAAEDQKINKPRVGNKKFQLLVKGREGEGRVRFKRESILSLPSPEKGGLIRERGRIWEGGGA